MKKIFVFLLVLVVGVASWFGSAAYNGTASDAALSAARDAAYQSGYDAGYSAGTKDGKNAGYDSGYSAGVRDAQQSSAPDRSAPSSGSSSSKQAWPGVDPEREVYVSDRSKTVHSKSNCSGMKHYSAMSAWEAYAHNYDRCSKCW